MWRSISSSEALNLCSAACRWTSICESLWIQSPKSSYEIALCDLVCPPMFQEFSVAILRLLNIGHELRFYGRLEGFNLGLCGF